MTGKSVAAGVKRTSSLRRLPPIEKIELRPEHAGESDVCAFELPPDSVPITVESATGRMMAIAPGEVFLATPGWLETRRMAVGGIPAGGLVPEGSYWVLSYSGVVGELVSSHAGADMGHLGRVRYLGAVCGDRGRPLNIRQFAVTDTGGTDRKAPVYLMLGTSSEVGKTTAGVSVLRTLRMQGHKTVIALKATGLPAIAEIAQYQDFGASQAFDCIDFGLPTTFPPGRKGIKKFLGHMLDYCLSLPADAVLVECAGDPVSANAPELLSCLKARRRELKIILAAADALGAMGAKHALAEIGLEINLITGPCTDTPVLRERTEALCGIPAINLAGSLRDGTLATSELIGVAEPWRGPVSAFERNRMKRWNK
jgi:hypothetical protein